MRVGGKSNPNAPIELYDLESDPAETTNIADAHPDIIKEVQAVFDNRTVSEIEGWNFAVAE